MKNSSQDELHLAIVGHVDHGKSSILGRLLADIDALPDGKLEAVKQYCKNNAKPFEYAFLLDALKAEQAQGITIDTARCFFNTDKRRYIILDTPGHLEFLRNMVTGASHAEAALLIIDAAEGVQDNSYRHGHLLSLLGINQVAVIINKMDLVSYSEDTFNQVKNDYKKFLDSINVSPIAWIPTSAREGDNISKTSNHMNWYTGPTIFSCIENLTTKGSSENRPFRLPVQDIYKFTEDNDNRRIVAGTINSGKVSVGDEVKFSPSGHTSTIKSIEIFNADTRNQAVAGEAVGFTLTDELYIKPGDIMHKKGSPTQIGQKFKANIFWLGQTPLSINKRYKLKLASSNVFAYIESFVSTLDAKKLVRNTDQTTSAIEKNHIAECTLITERTFAFDLVSDDDTMSRFVIVDDYEISGGGIITENIINTAEDAKENCAFIPEIQALNIKQSSKKTPNTCIITCEESNPHKREKIIKEALLEGRFNTNYYCLQLPSTDNKLIQNKFKELVFHILNTGRDVGIISENTEAKIAMQLLKSITNLENIKHVHFDKKTCDIFSKKLDTVAS